LGAVHTGHTSIYYAVPPFTRYGVSRSRLAEDRRDGG
jgi:hypothetical protein